MNIQKINIFYNYLNINTKAKNRNIFEPRFDTVEFGAKNKQIPVYTVKTNGDDRMRHNDILLGAREAQCSKGTMKNCIENKTRKISSGYFAFYAKDIEMTDKNGEPILDEEGEPIVDEEKYQKLLKEKQDKSKKEPTRHICFIDKKTGNLVGQFKNIGDAVNNMRIARTSITTSLNKQLSAYGYFIFDAKDVCLVDDNDNLILDGNNEAIIDNKKLEAVYQNRIKQLEEAEIKRKQGSLKHSKNN